MLERFEELVEEVVARIRALLERGEIYAKHARLHAPGGIDPVPMPTGGGGGGSGGHEIQEDGTALPQRPALNFGQGLVAQDNAQAVRTDVNVEYGGQADVAPADAGQPQAGTLLRLARADHKHSANVASPVELADSSQEGSASTLARSDHVHKRSVRVKSGTSDFARNALNISGLGVADDATNDEVDIVHDASSPGHHPQVHGADDHQPQSDAEAIHDNVAGEIAALPEKLTPAATDLLLIEDSASGNAKRKVQVGNLPGGGGGAHAIDGASHTGTLDVGDAQLPAPPAGYPADVAATRADGTSARVARADHVHAHGSGYLPDAHHAQVHSVDGSDHTGTLDIGDPQLPAPPAGYPANVAAAKADGTSTRVARADHVHAHGTGYLPDAHHPRAHDHSAAADGNALSPAVLNLPQAASPAQTAEGQVVWDSTNDKLTVGDGVGRKVMAREDQAVMDGDAAGGELAGTYPNPTVATVHAGSAHHAQVHAIDGSDHTGTLDIGDAQLPAPPAGYPADVAATKADGASTRVARADHVHAHGTGYLPDAHHPQAHGDSDHTGPSRVEVQDEGTTVGTRTVLNFTGTGVRATDNAAAGRVDIEVPGSATIQLLLDGGGSAITAGLKAYVEVPFDCAVTGWTVVADQTGSIQIDVWRSTYAGFPPTSAGSIAGTEKPRLNAQQKNQDLALTTWTTSLARGDWLAFNVDAASTVTLVTLSLRLERA